MKVKPDIKSAVQLLLDGSLALAKAESKGIKVDVNKLDKTISETESKIQELTKQLQEDTVWRQWKREFGDKASLTKPQQLATVVYDLLGYECRLKTDKGGRSTSASALEHIDLPFIKELVKLQSLIKLNSTFLQGLRRETVDGFFHPTFKLHTTTTYRSSSGMDRDSGSGRELNFQNLPIRNSLQGPAIRSCFIPRKGRELWEVDYGAMEFRIAASVWGDAGMISYASDHNKDIHYDQTALCYDCQRDQVSKDMRSVGKNKFVFPILYGSYYVSCARDLWEAITRMELKLKDGTPLLKHLKGKRLGSKEALEQHIKRVEEKFYSTFSTFAQRKDALWQEYHSTGQFPLLTGFTVKGSFKRNFVLNAVVQGVAFHCLLWSLVKLTSFLEKHKFRSIILGQIHDCMLIDGVPEERDEVLDICERIMTKGIQKHWDWVTVPLITEVDCTPVDGSWHTKKPVERVDGVWKWKGK